MPRPRTGTVWRHKDHYDYRITLPYGQRSPGVCLSPEVDLDQAKAIALEAARAAIVVDKKTTKIEELLAQLASANAEISSLRDEIVRLEDLLDNRLNSATKRRAPRGSS